MAMTVIFHRLALQEYDVACRRYEQRSRQTRTRFEDAIDHALKRIAEDPEQWPLFRNDIRWVRTGRYPYVLYFRVLDVE